MVYEEVPHDDNLAKEDHPYCSEKQMAVFIGYETDTEEINLDG